MFIAVKKKTLLSVLFVVIIAVCTGLLFVPALSVGAGSETNGKTVVIDAGHGGIDGGVVGVNTGTKESDLNLAVARKLKTYLTQGGYKVVMTRTNSDGLYGLAAKNKKLKDMETRKEKINEAAPTWWSAFIRITIRARPCAARRYFTRPARRRGRVLPARCKRSSTPIWRPARAPRLRAITISCNAPNTRPFW